MKPASIVGIVLIILGIIGLAYQGITYTRQQDVADIGPIHAVKTEHRTIPIPPILAAIALIGGIGLVAVGAKSGS
jgi:hypothetical protein